MYLCYYTSNCHDLALSLSRFSFIHVMFHVCHVILHLCPHVCHVSWTGQVTLWLFLSGSSSYLFMYILGNNKTKYATTLPLFI